MLKKEYFDSWNELFPECLIRHSDLVHPTETFLTKILVAYLKRFNYKVEPPFSLGVEGKENNKENRKFLIKLVNQIDHMLKITDESFTFTYYDLIRPSPKKTSNMLHILLNYLFYYNLYKEEVFKIANERITALKELRFRIDNIRQENERRHQQSKDLKESVENLRKELPSIKKDWNIAKDKLESSKQDLYQTKNEVNDLKQKLEDLNEEQRSLNKRVVPNEESEELHMQYESLKKKLNALENQEKSLEKSIISHKDKILKSIQLKKYVEKALNVISIDLLNEYEESSKETKELEHKLHQSEEMRKHLILEIEKLTESLKDVEQKRIENKNEYKIRFNEQHLKNVAQQKELNEKTVTMLQLKKQIDVTESRIEEQRNMKEFLINSITQLLAPYMQPKSI